MQLFVRALLVIVVGLLAGCSSLWNGPDRPPTQSEIIGTYDMGHAGFEEILELHPDGSYTRTLLGHLGQSDATFQGSWRLSGKYLFFQPVPTTPSLSSLIQAETFFYRHKPAFVRTQDLQNGRAGEWWVYQRRDGK